MRAVEFSASRLLNFTIFRLKYKSNARRLLLDALLQLGAIGDGDVAINNPRLDYSASVSLRCDRISILDFNRSASHYC